MNTMHKITFGDCRNMKKLKDNSIDLVVTSPPYYNAPFDFPGMFKSYEEFLQLMKDVAKELIRVMKQGRIVCLVTDDMLVDGVKYPIIADITPEKPSTCQKFSFFAFLFQRLLSFLF